MSRGGWIATVAWIATTAWSASGCAPATCDEAGLTAALAAASEGDVVELGACRVDGTFEVPAGVTLRGIEGAVLSSADAEAPVLTLAAGARVEALRVESAARAGVVARGDGFAIVDVEVEVERGIGIGLAGSGQLARVRVEGPVTAENATDATWVRVVAAPVSPGACPSADCECEPGETDPALGRACDEEGRWASWTAVFGVYLVGGTVTLEDVEIRGFARFGLVADDASLTWSGGLVRDGIGVGVLARGGHATLLDVEVAGIVEGLRGIPSYSVIASEGARLDTERVRLVEGQRFGLLTLEATGAHEALSVEDHGDVGVWVGQSDDFTLSGALLGNGFAGLVVASSAHVAITDARVEGTRTVRRSTSTFGAREVGDGVHLTDSLDDVTLTRVSLAANERVGLLVDLGAGAGPVFDAVTVDAAGAALGAVAGTRDDARGVIVTSTGGWDTGIERTGAAIDNDLAPPAELDAIVAPAPPELDAVRGIVAPMY